MMLSRENIIRIWKSKGQIVEGITNSIFKSEDVEQIANERLAICYKCPSDLYDASGDGCIMAPTAPCCNLLKGGCGCSLKLKTRSLSSECPKGYWKAELTEHEEQQLKEKLAL